MVRFSSLGEMQNEVVARLDCWWWNVGNRGRRNEPKWKRCTALIQKYFLPKIEQFSRKIENAISAVFVLFFFFLDRHHLEMSLATRSHTSNYANQVTTATKARNRLLLSWRCENEFSSRTTPQDTIHSICERRNKKQKQKKKGYTRQRWDLQGHEVASRLKQFAAAHKSMPRQ